MDVIRVLILENEIEAGLMDELLKEKEIPHIIQSYHDMAYDGIFQHHMGWGHIEAEEKYSKDIIEIYNSIKVK